MTAHDERIAARERMSPGARLLDEIRNGSIQPVRTVRGENGAQARSRYARRLRDELASRRRVASNTPPPVDDSSIDDRLREAKQEHTRTAGFAEKLDAILGKKREE